MSTVDWVSRGSLQAGRSITTSSGSSASALLCALTHLATLLVWAKTLLSHGDSSWFSFRRSACWQLAVSLKSQSLRGFGLINFSSWIRGLFRSLLGPL